MKYIWLLFMVMIIFRMIWRLSERSRSQGKFDGPWGSPSPGQKDLPWKRAPKGEEREFRPKLNLPEYLTRRSDGAATGNADSKEEGKLRPAVENGATGVGKQDWKMKPEKTLREERSGDTAVLSKCLEDQKETAPRERHGWQGDSDLFDDVICPGEVIKGIVWSQILGPRGGHRAKRR